ncbi:hypothetical protein C5N14_27000 [Micromonospora sp. MW-13]|nr:hypothetical protein C5N14_27000 [Micromonospora sp. MW-13]
MQRLATDAGPVHRPGPQADPKFAALKADVRGKQQVLGAHPPATAEASKAQGAAKAPQDDKEAQGKAANAEKMNAAKPGEFDKAAFVRAVNEAIAAQAPKNLDEADKFGDSGKADAVKGQVQGQVTDGKKASANAIETTTKAPPDTSQVKDKQVTPLVADKPPATPGTPDPAKAVPDKAPPAATDLSGGPKQVDQQMAEAQVTEEQLAKSNEPEFTGALKEKDAVEQHAATAPGQVRAAEAQTLSGAKAAAGAAGATAMTALAGDRKQAGQSVGAGKEQAKSADEAKREKVTATLQKVFDATKKDVEEILSGLDKKVDEKFSAGEKAARDAFTAEHTRRMDEYKDKRYSGLLGKGRWIKDKFAGLPEEANQIFVTARKGYVDRMQQVISAVADVIGAELTRAKQRIATGRDQLQAEVKKLPADLQAIGKEAAGEFAGKFDELTESVNNKGTELVQTLATKYNEALKSVDEEIAAEKEKNKGLVAKAVDAVAGVIKTIMQLKDMLMGVLAKAAQAVMAIIKDPIGFLGNLVSAVGAGLKQFLANIGEHLKKGLVGWLTGAMAGAGLELPAKFDLRGIVMMIGSLLGLTWASIRGLIIKRGVPEPAMGAVEKSVPLVQKVQAQGLGGLWEEIQDKVGDLKANLFSKISEYLIPTVLMAGITWIISLLNPASAFVRAVKMIIDFVTFIVTQGAQIIEFVNSVLDAIIAIAGGGTGGVPGLIEKALARSVPVLIGVLAAVLGVGGIAQRVQKFFKGLAAPVMKAVGRVADKIAAIGKKLWAKFKAKVRGGDDSPQGKQKRLEKGLAAAVSAARRFSSGGVSRTALRAVFAGIRLRYGMTSLEPVLTNGRWAARGTVNPTGQVDLGITATDGQQPPQGPLTKKDDEYVKQIAQHLPPMGDRFAGEARSQWNKELAGTAVGGTLVWGDPPLSPQQMPGAGVKVLEDPGTHRILLPYFHAKNRTGGATSDTFYAYAFKFPAIRSRLLAILGADALAELKAPRAGRAADVNAQLNDLAFHSAIGKFGAFAPIPGAGAGADAELIAAVNEAGGIVPFFKHVVRKKGPWETKIFDLWKNDKPSKDFLADRFRAADAGKHEWIPTDYIPDVLRRAMDHRSGSETLEGLRWVVLHHALRSPTRYVIWELVGTTPQGHSGVFWQAYQEDGKTKHKFTLTNNQEAFHNRLRKLFDQWSGTALAYVGHLRAQLSNLMWDGNLGQQHQPFLTKQVDALVSTDRGKISMTVEELGLLQRANFADIKVNFLDAEDAVKKEEL